MYFVTLSECLILTLVLQFMMVRAPPPTTGESKYLKSHNSAGWSAARRDCQEQFGKTAGLAAIETPAELQDLLEFMNLDDDSGSQFWIGGLFDTHAGEYTWDTGANLKPWIKWDTRYPQTKDKATRISMSYDNNGIYLKTSFATQSLRYICEKNK